MVVFVQRIVGIGPGMSCRQLLRPWQAVIIYVCITTLLSRFDKYISV
jgi:hypothetical protein